QNDDTQLAVTGPVTPGETVLVRLRVQPPPERTVLVLHLRDGDNQPFEQKHVEVALEARNGNSSSSSTFGIDTDSEGVLRLSVEDSYRTMPERSLRLRGKWRNQQDAGEAMVTLPAALLPGENDLGIVPLLLSPLVCGGTVVDHLGTAVEGAQLQVHVLPATGTAAPEPRQVRGLRGRSDHDGHFALRGVCPAGELSLRVAAAGHLPSTQPFLLGTGSLRIELAAAAALTGSVRLDDVITAPDVLVELVTASGESSQRLDVRGALGEFRFDALQPGVATVRIRVLGEVDGGLVVAELPLRSGEQTRDPRLQAVDLSNGRRAVHFTVVDSDGRPVQEAKVVVLAGKDQHAFEGYLLTAGQGRIVTRANPLEVLVFATGYRAARVSELADGARIVLPSPLSLHLQLPPECPPPAAPFTLEVRLEPRNSAWPSQASYRFFGGLHSEHSGDGQLPWLQATTATCGPGGDVLVQLFEPGTHAISWRLSRHQPSDRTDQWVVNEPQTVEVRDVPTEQQLRAGPSAEQLDAAKARLGG
ncbi:MAG TPA: carboxypeptidase-like regulatory domain-containing protein, partial [Planctomycetota bacterium]|nr:carboxypeptidase-like regulatory domain-containing protein [Planctomycetota bacterium]